MRTLLLTVLAAARLSLKSRRALALENLALRQQLAVLRRQAKRPKLSRADRAFWLAVRVRRPRTRATTHRAFQRHRRTQCLLDGPAGHQRVPRRDRPALPASRPGRHLWERVHLAGPLDGPCTGGECGALALAEPLRR